MNAAKTFCAHLPGPSGEPDLELRGLDVYDPTTGEIRSSSTDDIACWFIDSDYNEESFFVRHAYFTGADEPYKKLPQGGDRRGRLVNPLQHRQLPVRGAVDRQDRCEGDQPLRGRGAEGVPVSAVSDRMMGWSAAAATPLQAMAMDGSRPT